MSANDTPIAPNSTSPSSIDLNSDASIAEWAHKLDVSEAQLKEAVATVGDRATDVEMHLKGRAARRTTKKFARGAARRQAVVMTPKKSRRTGARKAAARRLPRGLPTQCARCV